MISPAVYDYLKRNPRRFKLTRNETLELFERHSVPALECFVDFQIRFGGYCPEVEEMTFGIVTPLGDDPRHGAEVVDGMARVDFAVDCDVQVRFGLDENGLVYYDHLPVAESFESYLQHRCYVDKCLHGTWTQITHDRRDTKNFKRLFEKQKLRIVDEATDQFHSIKRSDGVVWIDRGGHYDEVFVKPEVFYA